MGVAFTLFTLIMFLSQVLVWCSASMSVYEGFETATFFCGNGGRGTVLYKTGDGRWVSEVVDDASSYAVR